MKKITIIIASLTFLSSITFAQKRNSRKAKVEQSIATCEAVAFKDRNILAVVDFDVTARSVGRKIGSGMSDMLSNALVECNCFRIVERDRLSKVREEQHLSGMNVNSAAQVNQLTGAELLVMGNITEFQEKSGGAGGAAGALIGRKLGVGAIGVTNAQVGMIVKVVHATTGEILLSKSLERKVSKVGVAGGGTLPIPGGGGFYKSKAMEDAIEETLLEAVGLIVERQADIAEALSGEQSGGTKSTHIAIKNADFKALMSLSKFLNGLDYVEQVDKKLDGNIARLSVAYSTDQESFMMDLIDQSGLRMDIESFDEQSITLALK